MSGPKLSARTVGVIQPASTPATSTAHVIHQATQPFILYERREPSRRETPSRQGPGAHSCTIAWKTNQPRQIARAVHVGAGTRATSHAQSAAEVGMTSAPLLYSRQIQV